jgi:hypothetical protein
MAVTLSITASIITLVQVSIQVVRYNRSIRMSTNQTSDDVLPNVGRLDDDFRHFVSNLDKVEVLKTVITHMTN